MIVRSLIVLAVVFFVSSTQMSRAHPLGLKVDDRSASIKPVTQSGITQFGLRSGQCSAKPYPWDRGENDCRNGNIRSSLDKKWTPLGKSVRYAFDFWIEPGVKYRGYSNSLANGYLAGGWDTRLRIAAWLGDGKHNYLYQLKLDGVSGVRFVGKTCAGPREFGRWISFEMLVRWSRTKDGVLQVKCNGNLIFSMAGKPTTIDVPHCYITNLCNPKLGNDPRQIGFELGLVMQGFGPEWKKYGKPNPFTTFEGEIGVKVRNVQLQSIRLP